MNYVFSCLRALWKTEFKSDELGYLVEESSMQNIVGAVSTSNCMQ